MTHKDDFVSNGAGHHLHSETMTHRVNVFCDELLDWVVRFKKSSDESRI